MTPKCQIYCVMRLHYTYSYLHLLKKSNNLAVLHAHIVFGRDEIETILAQEAWLNQWALFSHWMFFFSMPLRRLGIAIRYIIQEWQMRLFVCVWWPHYETFQDVKSDDDTRTNSPNKNRDCDVTTITHLPPTRVPRTLFTWDYTTTY